MSKLTIKIGASISALKSGLAKAKNKLKSFAGMAKGVFAMGGLSGAGIAVFAKNIIDNLDQIGKSAKAMGTSSEFFQKLSFAAERSGSSIEQATAGMKRMTRVVNDAGNGLMSAKRSLSQIGLTADDLKGKSVDKQFEMIAEALNGVKDSSKKAAIAQEIFGRAGAGLIPMIADYKSLAEEAEKAGIIISDNNVKAAEEFKDSITNMNKALVALTVDSGFIKWLADVADRMASVAKHGNFLSGIYKEMTGGSYGDDNTHDYEREQKRLELIKRFRSRGQNAAADALEGKLTSEKDRIKAKEITKNAADEKKKKEAAAAASKDSELMSDVYKQIDLEDKQKEKIHDQIAAMEQKLKIQKMINAGKEKEAAVEQAVAAAAKAAGRDLTDTEKASVAKLAGDLYDASHKTKKKTTGPSGSPYGKEHLTDALARMGGTLGGASSGLSVAKDSNSRLKSIEKSIASIDEKTELNFDDGGRKWA